VETWKIKECGGFMNKLISNWRNKNLRCHFCGETRSVKYTMKIFDPIVDSKSTEVCVCNKCALRYIDKEIKE
jgi:hypothetical protein